MSFTQTNTNHSLFYERSAVSLRQLSSLAQLTNQFVELRAAFLTQEKPPKPSFTPKPSVGTGSLMVNISRAAAVGALAGLWEDAPSGTMLLRG